MSPFLPSHRTGLPGRAPRAPLSLPKGLTPMTPRRWLRLLAQLAVVSFALSSDADFRDDSDSRSFSWLSNLLENSSNPTLLANMRSLSPVRSIVHIPSSSLSDGGAHAAYVLSLDADVKSSLDDLLDYGVCLDNDGPCPSDGAAGAQADGQQPLPLSHGPGGDFSLLRLALRPDGTLWSGVAPSFPLRRSSPSPEGLLVSSFASFSKSGRHLFSKGFSLVVNKVQRRLPEVLRAALDVDQVVKYGESVSCNLYMTPASPPRSPVVVSGEAALAAVEDGAPPPPPSKVQGFEAHFDWMDVLVLQLSGGKTWRVYHSALSPNPSSPLKFKPSGLELSVLESSPGGVSVIAMRPGDLLFIPRGCVHEAWVEPNSREPSLHLTYGVELSPTANLEALSARVVKEAFESFGDDRGGVTKRAEKSVLNKIAELSLRKEYSYFRESYKSIDYETFRREILKLGTTPESDSYHDDDAPLISDAIRFASSEDVFQSAVSKMAEEEEARKRARNERWANETRLRRRVRNDEGEEEGGVEVLPR